MRAPDAPADARRTTVMVTAALAVGAIVVAGSAAGFALAGPDTGPDTDDDDASSSTQDAVAAAVPDLDLDLGPVADPMAAAAKCLGEDSSSAQALYAVEQRTESGAVPVLVLDRGDGDLLFCDMDGMDRPAVMPVPTATDSDPVAFLTNGRLSWDCDCMILKRHTSTTWLSVADEVAEVQQRYWVDGEAGPWFTTAAQDGYAHLQAWLTGPPEKADLQMEQRVLDSAGEPVSQSTIPTAKQPLAGCSGGDAQIG